MLGLYIHIPFCPSLCSYCNFARGLYDAELKDQYVAALEREIAGAGDGRPADTIFFGGGTPSMLAPADIARLIASCRASYAVTPDAEVTLETNPETVTSERAAAWLEAGVTRLSLGVQSFDDAELARLGRAHSVSRVHDALRIVREAGCRNLSFDLMLWLPGQTRASWSRTVETAAAVGADHLSLYLLELYPNAPLKDAMARVVDAQSPADPETRAAWAQAAEDDAADMYLEGLEILDRSGYAQYEISNVARAGFESRHNLKYWQSGAWRGFGCAAHSTVDGMRWRNVSSTVDYNERIFAGRSPGIDVHVLQPAGRAEEALFTGMRLSAGIDCGPFAARFGFDPWARFGASLQEYIAMGLVWRDESRFGLTRRGMLVANDIFITFLGPAS